MSKINEVAELVEKGKAKLVGPAVQEAIDEGEHFPGRVWTLYCSACVCVLCV